MFKSKLPSKVRPMSSSPSSGSVTVLSRSRLCVLVEYFTKRLTSYRRIPAVPRYRAPKVNRVNLFCRTPSLRKKKQQFQCFCNMLEDFSD